MRRRNYGAIGASALVVFLAASALGEQGTSLLKPGDALPPLAGQTVAGKPLDLPTAAEGKIAVVIFSFSRAGGRDAQNWAQHLSKDDPHLSIYSAIFLESVPRLFRSSPSRESEAECLQSCWIRRCFFISNKLLGHRDWTLLMKTTLAWSCSISLDVFDGLPWDPSRNPSMRASRNRWSGRR